MRWILVLIAIAVTAVFAAMNWGTFVTPTTLWIGARTIQAPLGLIMLGLMALMGMGFVIYALSFQVSAMAESRRQAKELAVQRDLADKAEASRFTELREFMRAELLRVTQAEDGMRHTILQRLDTLEQHSRIALTESLDQLEHRLERAQAQDPTRRH
jgi:hypothetical protein